MSPKSLSSGAKKHSHRPTRVQQSIFTDLYMSQCEFEAQHHGFGNDTRPSMTPMHAFWYWMTPGPSRKALMFLNSMKVIRHCNCYLSTMLSSLVKIKILHFDVVGARLSK